MIALSSRPFCPCDGRQVSLSYLAAGLRYTTSARGRKNRPQGCFEGLTPVQMLIVVEELVACDSEVKEALADTFEVVQERLLLDSRVLFSYVHLRCSTDLSGS